MTKTGNIFLWVVLLFLFPLQAFSATSVQATVDRNEMGLGDTFTVTVSVSSSDSVNAQEPRVPELEGFDLINKWDQTTVAQKLVNTSKGMQFETQRRKEYSYMLSPKQMGNLTVPSFEVVVDGKVYHTQSIPVKVEQNSPRGSAKKPRRQNPSAMPGMPSGMDSFDDMDNAEEELFNQLLQQRQQLMQQFGAGGNNAGNNGGGAGTQDNNEEDSGGANLRHPQFRSLPTNPNEAFFIQVEVDKTDVYEGEQVTVNWYIYTRGQMETLDRLKFPDLRGFWKEIIEEVPTIQFSEEIVNGIPYKKALLASHALFPIKREPPISMNIKSSHGCGFRVNGMGAFSAALTSSPKVRRR